MSINIDALFQHLMEDPDLIPPEGEEKEDIAMAMATQRAKQSNNNIKALNMAKAYTNVETLLAFLKAEEEEYQPGKLTKKQMGEYTKHLLVIEDVVKRLEAGETITPARQERARKAIEFSNQIPEDTGITGIPDVIAAHQTAMEARKESTQETSTFNVNNFIEDKNTMEGIFDRDEQGGPQASAQEIKNAATDFANKWMGSTPGTNHSNFLDRTFGDILKQSVLDSHFNAMDDIEAEEGWEDDSAKVREHQRHADELANGFVDLSEISDADIKSQVSDTFKEYYPTSKQPRRQPGAETDVEAKSSAVRELKGTTPRAYLLWFGSRLVIVI